MSDSFADLWNSSAPIKPQQAAPKLGAAASTGSSNLSSPNNPYQPRYDAFSLLAATSPSPGSSNANSRPLTPQQPQRIQPSSSGSSGSGASGRVGLGLGGGDAFSGLLSGSITGGSNNANMSIADRAAEVEREKRQKWMEEAEAKRKADAVWSQLDALSRTGASASTSKPAAPPVVADDDDWGFSALAPSPAPSSVPRKTTPQPAVLDDDDWGLGDFASPKETTSPPTRKAGQASLFEVDSLASLANRPTSRNNADPTEDFDFGSREDRFLDNHSDNEDDILGALSRPVEDQSKRANPLTTHSSPPPARPRRTASPPPHLIGQIVEMGFSPQQARVALAATDSGVDVQAALEALLANGDGADNNSNGGLGDFADSDGEGPPPPPQRRDRRSPVSTDALGAGVSATARARREILAEEEVPSRRRQRPTARERERGNETPPSGSATPANLQEQADKILAQASGIGLSMFSRANALWKEGREKVQKAYEERAATAATQAADGGRGSAGSGRPKWMQQAGEGDDEWAERREGERSSGSGYKDEDGDGNDEVLPQRRDPPRRQKPVPAMAPSPVSRDDNPIPDSTQRKSALSSLLADEPAAYVSPKRRRPAASQSATPPAPLPARAAPPSARAPSPLRTRPTVSASPSAIARSTGHKTSGGEMFKLGRYAEAETAYASAIAALPARHLILVQLHNNRALTRLKTGNTSGAIEDCTTALEIVGTEYHPAKEARVIGGEEVGAGVDLGDGWVKALRRRAEAYEGREKWGMALADWEKIGRADWAGKWRPEAAKGAGRCRRMMMVDMDSGAKLGASSGSAPPPARKAASAPAARPAPRRPAAPAKPSEALTRLREATEAQDAEENERYRLKDSVDERLLAWKVGKETNLRALLASLENVLWPELGWQKIGMAELVMPNQVKIRYTKAIAKLHPDKLHASNTTVEQRMIANGVFGTLNEAWNSFKP